MTDSLTQFRPQPRRCDCGAQVIDGSWYGGTGGPVVLDAEPVTVVRFLGSELTGWLATTDGSDEAKRGAARQVTFEDDRFCVHVCHPDALQPDRRAEQEGER